MPRKTKAFKSRSRDAHKAYAQGKPEEANKIWQQLTVDRAKFKADKTARSAAKKAASK